MDHMYSMVSHEFIIDYSFSMKYENGNNHAIFILQIVHDTIFVNPQWRRHQSSMNRSSLYSMYIYAVHGSLFVLGVLFLRERENIASYIIECSQNKFPLAAVPRSQSAPSLYIWHQGRSFIYHLQQIDRFNPFSVSMLLWCLGSSNTHDLVYI